MELDPLFFHRLKPSLPRPVAIIYLGGYGMKQIEVVQQKFGGKYRLATS